MHIQYISENFTVSNLHNWINVDEIQPLDLMGFYPMWTFHLWQHSYNSLSEGTIIAIIYTKTVPTCSSDADLECNIISQKPTYYLIVKLKFQQVWILLTFFVRWWSFLGREDRHRCQCYRWWYTMSFLPPPIMRRHIVIINLI